MSQLEQMQPEFIDYALKLIKSKTLKEKRETAEMELLHGFNGEQGRVLCPLCQYSSSKNKMSAIVKQDRFKCFACGASRRIA